jgi:hypothetical protein
MADDFHNQLYRKDMGTEVSIKDGKKIKQACDLWCRSNVDKVNWVPSDDSNDRYTVVSDDDILTYCFMNDEDAEAFEAYIESERFELDLKYLNNAHGSWINSNAISIRVNK